MSTQGTRNNVGAISGMISILVTEANRCCNWRTIIGGARLSAFPPLVEARYPKSAHAIVRGCMAKSEERFRADQHESRRTLLDLEARKPLSLNTLNGTAHTRSVLSNIEGDVGEVHQSPRR